MYLIASRPDIAYATFVCARYQARPTVKHLKEVKRIFRYLRQSYNMGLWYPKDSGFKLIAYSDADHAGYKDDCKSTSRGLQFLVIIMAQQQHAADVHPDELCPPNKRYDLMDANKKIDFEQVQYRSKNRLTFMLDKKELSLTLDDFRTIFHLPQVIDNNHDSFVPAPSFLTCHGQTFMQKFSNAYNTLTDGINHRADNANERALRQNEDSILDYLRRNEAHGALSDVCEGVWDRCSSNSAPSRTESTQGTHRTPSAPRSPNPNMDAGVSSAPKRSTVIRFCIPQRRSTRLTPPAPVPTVDKADEMILQDTLQVSLAEHKSQEEQEVRENMELVNEHLASVEIEKMVEGPENESPEVEITNDKEVEITNVVIPVNVNEEEEEITEVYELKRREKRKIVEESRSTPFPTPIRSPRIHTDLISLDTEKLQELKVTDTTPTPSSSSPNTKLSTTNRLLSLFKAKPARFKRYKSFFQELQGRYGYLFEHLKAWFLSRKSFDTLADHLQEVMVESLPTMVDKHIKEQVEMQVPEQVKVQVPVYVVKRLFLERQQNKEETDKMIAKAMLQERGKLQAEISSQIQNAIDTNIPSLVDASVRSYMSGHILHVHPAQPQTTYVPEQQYQLYLSMKSDPQLQQQDIAIEDPHDDAHPEGENSAKRQMTSECEAHVTRESFGQVNEKEQDDDEILMKQVSQDIMEEVSLTINEAKLKKIADEIKEILASLHPQKTTPLVQSCQRDPEVPALSLINQDLLYLKKGSSRPEKIVLSLHKFPAIIFNDVDIEERTSRWVNKCVKKFNPYARYGVEHWKNPHAKIFYIKMQKEPGKPKEVVYSNSKIIQVIKTYWELGHEHKFITEIVARTVNECIVSITESDYKNLKKDDIEDMYLLIMNGKVLDYAETGLLWSLSVFIRRSVIWERVHDFQLEIESYQHKVNLTAPTISFPGIEKHKMFSVIYELMHGIIYKNSKKEKRVMRHSEIHKICDATLNRVLESLKSYNNDVKYGYIQAGFLSIPLKT
ncbi:hypothetical protein Tco_1351725 [Tanacetum coccineum]